jgi:sugar phosphate isomerase/epimerase
MLLLLKVHLYKIRRPFMKIGAQLYTVRQYAQTEGDLKETVAKIAAIGYGCVQISGIGPIPAQAVADICAAQGLDIVLTHTAPHRIKDETEAVIAEHKLMGASYIGIGSLPGYYADGTADYQKFIKEYLPAAKAIKEAGLTFMYHNHDFEFEKRDGNLIIEHLAEGFPPGTMGFTLDTYWVQAGGGSPSAWLRKLAGRVNVIHLKDMAWRGGKPYMCEIMEGNLDWAEIYKAGTQAGVQYAMVEQDDCHGEDPFTCLKTSFDNWTSVF